MWHLFLIGVIGFFVYLNVLNGDFIWDDDVYIRYNTHITSYSYLPSVFSERMADGYIGRIPSGNFYRPLQKILYIVGHSLWGMQPFGYRLLNVILHIAVALCFYWLITLIFSDQILAWMAALLYVVHPVHVEAIGNMSGTQDPLSSVFVLLALIFYLKTDRSLRISCYLITFFCFLGALLSKENSIVLPLILLLYHYVCKKKVKPMLFLSLAGLSVLYLVIRVTALDCLPVEAGKASQMMARIPVFFAALINYIRILFFPLHLRVHYGDVLFKFSDTKVLLGILFFISVLWYAVKNREKDRFFLFAAGWFFIFLMPLANIYPVNDSFMKEHWLYLPSIGFFLIVSRLLLTWCRDKKLKNLGVISFAVLLLFYSFCTIRLNNYWSDPFTFFKRSLRYSPDYAVFYNELGIECEKRGLFKEALVFYQKALVKNRRYIDPYFNVSRSLIREGRYAEAAGLFKQLLKNDPENLSLYYSLAYCYDKMSKKDEADKLRHQALAKSFEFAQKYRGEGDKLVEMDRPEEAVAAYKSALGFAPKDFSLYNDLGKAYLLNGDFKGAIQYFQKALLKDPSCAAIYNNLALAFYYGGEYSQSVRYCDEALKLGYPVDSEFLSRLKPYREKTGAGGFR